MTLLGNPRSFKAKIVSQQIHLSIPEDELYEVEKVLTCSICGALVDKGSRVCKNCGMVIT
ncbi:MAG: zinc ribbon domain-containing protein [Candidatus Heimdallarchaeota archaeon]